MARTLKCPRCKSTNIQVLGDTKKPFSVGKAIVGGVLWAPFTLFGFAGKKGKLQVHCVECGGRWKTK